MNKDLTKKEKSILYQFIEETKKGEFAQARDLINNCNISYQFAKTHSVYIEDWENTKNKMQEILKSGNLPDEISPELMKLMITNADKIMKEKLEMVRKGFEKKFGESIYNYLGPDGKTKSIF